MTTAPLSEYEEVVTDWIHKTQLEKQMPNLIPLERKDFHKFWMVWNPNGRSPSYRHLTLDAAKQEAARLARQNHSETFCVLECVGAVQLEPPPAYWFDAVEREQADADDAEPAELA